MIAVARRVGDRVRVAPNAHGERTGTEVQGRAGVVADVLPADRQEGRERYWIRMLYGTSSLFFDWVHALDLRDY